MAWKAAHAGSRSVGDHAVVRTTPGSAGRPAAIPRARLAAFAPATAASRDAGCRRLSDGGVVVTAASCRGALSWRCRVATPDRRSRSELRAVIAVVPCAREIAHCAFAAREPPRTQGHCQEHRDYGASADRESRTPLLG